VCQIFLGAPYTPSRVSAGSTSDPAFFQIDMTYIYQ
jgi:hypothetical protein